MDLTFLGTGGSVPTTKRNTVSIALRLGPEVLMFDCGEGTQRQLMASSVSFMKITNIFISHHHGDHFLGLPGLIQSMNFYGREAPLNVYGPIGTQEMVKTILRLGIFDRKYEVQGHDLAPGEVVIGDGYQVAAFKANHTTPALGYAFQENDRPGRFDPDKAKALGVREGPNFSRLVEGYSVQVGSSKVTPDMVMGPSRKGLRLVYSGDTAASSELDQACVDADVLIHEATVASDLEAKAREFGHSTAKDAALLARDSGVSELYLVHISGRYEDADVLLDEARGIFEKTTIPNDLDVYVLRTDR
ncbi:MAG TPA: ribonuclease Z [Methanomassiliicoccales archaeon]|nr:ribonuclease Z [Methanomassiliicoccales archaeon]